MSSVALPWPKVPLAGQTGQAEAGVEKRETQVKQAAALFQNMAQRPLPCLHTWEPWVQASWTATSLKRQSPGKSECVPSLPKGTGHCCCGVAPRLSGN